MTTATFTLPARRFAWKEYRTLRGLWLAVAALAIIIQAISALLAAPGTDVAAWLFGTALTAAVLYAVGAAAILFAVEHEDETYNFLTGLPVTWLPVFAGKLLVASTSALALAAALSITGRTIAGGHWPSPTMTHQCLAIGGLGIFEAIAWGTLFSLLTKRPIVAALLTLAVGTIATQLVVSEVVQAPLSSGDPIAYIRAVPYRVAVLAILMLLNISLAQRWLGAQSTFGKSAPAGTRPSAAPTTAGHAGDSRSTAALPRLKSLLTTFAQSAASLPAAAFNRFRNASFTRLFWQTWRESWQLFFLPILGTLIVLFGAAISGTWHSDLMCLLGIAAAACTLPALYGALAFGADQRRRQFRFLAEHAAPPHTVWSARQFVWIGAMLAICAAIFIPSTFFLAFTLQRRLEFLAMNQYWRSMSHDALEYTLLSGPAAIAHGAGVAIFALFTAYSLGQLCSMLIRSEIMAAFATIILTILLTCWAAALVAWQLSGTLFLIPLAFGCMLATWLRAPDWLAERNTWRAWWKPLAAFIAPLLCATLYLPPSRLDQVPLVPPEQLDPFLAKAFEKLTSAEQIKAKTVAEKYFDPDSYLAGDTPEARQTADMYLRAAESYQSPAGGDDPPARWARPEYFKQGGVEVGAIDELRIPIDELDDFHNAQKESFELELASRKAAIAQFLAATERPNCRFHFEPSMVPPPGPYTRSKNSPQESKVTDHSFERISKFITQLSLDRFKDGDGIDSFMPLLRACEHLGSGQPTYIYMRQLSLEREILDRIADWAVHDNPSQDQLREALTKLTAHFATLPNPAEALLVDRAHVRDVLLGTQPAAMFASPPVDWEHCLAFIANRFPWEGQRALRAVDVITRFNLADTNKLVDYLTGHSSVEHANWWLRQWIRSGNDLGELPDHWLIAEPAAATSYLARYEYEARVSIRDFYRQLCDIETCRRATLLQIALAAHRQQHGTYPTSLTDLVPEYFDTLLRDPYSGQPFIYVPRGLDLPLAMDRPRRELVRTQFANSSYVIPAETPLFWSVGPTDDQLQRRVFTHYDRDANSPNADPVETTQEFYILSTHDLGWYYQSDLVFPLAK